MDKKRYSDAHAPLKKPLRVALVHDGLNQFGGAERVLLALAEIFHDAPIYTLFYDKEIFGGFFSGREIKTSFLDNPVVRRYHRLFIPFMALAAASINLGDRYDLIITSSASFAKGVRYGHGKHLSYVHALLRYAWDADAHLKTYFPAAVVKLILPIAGYLKWWDRKTGQKPDLILTNSRHTQAKIKAHYGRDAGIIHPPLDESKFYLDASVAKGNYFLSFGRIINYKRHDIIIEAFEKLSLPLVIAGAGTDERIIRRLIKSPNIKMIGRVHDHELRALINGAQACIFPQIEEFGLVAAESIACGTPIIALNRGGFRDILQDGINGIGLEEQSAEAIIGAVQKLEKMRFDRREVAATAAKFSKSNFQRRMLEIVNSLEL